MTHKDNDKSWVENAKDYFEERVKNPIYENNLREAAMVNATPQAAPELSPFDIQRAQDAIDVLLHFNHADKVTALDLATWVSRYQDIILRALTRVAQQSTAVVDKWVRPVIQSETIKMINETP